MIIRQYFKDQDKRAALARFEELLSDEAKRLNIPYEVESEEDSLTENALKASGEEYRAASVKGGKGKAFLFHTQDSAGEWRYLLTYYSDKERFPFIYKAVPYLFADALPYMANPLERPTEPLSVPEALTLKGYLRLLDWICGAPDDFEERAQLRKSLPLSDEVSSTLINQLRGTATASLTDKIITLLGISEDYTGAVREAMRKGEPLDFSKYELPEPSFVAEAIGKPILSMDDYRDALEEYIGGAEIYESLEKDNNLDLSACLSFLYKRKMLFIHYLIYELFRTEDYRQIKGIEPAQFYLKNEWMAWEAYYKIEESPQVVALSFYLRDYFGLKGSSIWGGLDTPRIAEYLNAPQEDVIRAKNYYEANSDFINGLRFYDISEEKDL